MEGISKDVIISENEKCLFNKMINISVNSKTAKKIFLFGCFLKPKGFDDILKIILADNTFLRCVCAEAEWIWCCLKANIIRKSHSHHQFLVH